MWIADAEASTSRANGSGVIARGGRWLLHRGIATATCSTKDNQGQDCVAHVSFGLYPICRSVIAQNGSAATIRVMRGDHSRAWTSDCCRLSAGG